MPKAKNLPARKPDTEKPVPGEASETADEVQETPFEALASICSVLVIGLFVLTFVAQNMLIPSGSMEKTLLVGDHLMVDRATFAPPAKWMPLEHYREPKRGDIVVFIKPAADPKPDGTLDYPLLVKRLIAGPGDRIHLRDGIVVVNGVAQTEPYAALGPDDYPSPYIDNFPSVPTSESGGGVTEEWAVDLPNHIQGNDLVVPQGMYFMMGDHRHHSLDSRYWGFVPRANIMGRPLFNYWSFKTPDSQEYKTGFGDQISWMLHVVVRFFADTRWSRTLHPIR